jgi:hypothetical protein
MEFRFASNAPGSKAGARPSVWCDDDGREVGLEKLGGLEGGEAAMCLKDDAGSQPIASAVSDEAACGELGRKGPSRAFAGDSARLPGMVSKPCRYVGDEWTAALISQCTEEVSHESKALSMETASPAGQAGRSMEDFADPFTNLILEELFVPTFVDDDRLVLGTCDVGVLGGECSVMSWDANDWWVAREAVRASSICTGRMPKSRSSLSSECLLSEFLIHIPSRV